MAKPILVLAEQRDGSFRKSAYEVVNEGRRLADQLGTELMAVVLGSDVQAMAASLGQYGADKALVAESDIFKHYSAEGYTRVMVDVIKAIEPSIVLIPATALGKDLAPRIAARMELGLAMDCTKLFLSEGKLQAERPIYAGKTLIQVGFQTSPQMATLRPNVFPVGQPNSSRTAKVEKIDVTVAAPDLKAVVKQMLATGAGKMDLTEANVIVSGGRGMKGPENFKILEELADLLGGVVGASRAAVDAGWRDHADQVGQTGKVVSPNLYIACGISGSIQHLAGMASSKCIVAINKDPDAPIFQRADYGIVGDLFEVVPALTAELKKSLSS